MLSLDAKGQIKDKILSDRKVVSIYPHEAELLNSNFRTNKFWYEVDMEFEDSLKAPKVDREALKLEADSLGLEYPSNIKTDKLIELINNNK